MFTQLIEITRAFIEHYGLVALGLFSFTESIIQPIPIDPFLATISSMGFNVHLAFVVAFVSNIIGACVAYFLGQRYGHGVAVRFFGQKKVDKVEYYINKYGVFAVFVISFTPAPYKLASWGSGIFEMPFCRFLISSLVARGLRFAMVAYGFHFLFLK